ncbi:hypothetical protein JR316_0003177 [Psilocybe cubensis]|uniref:F-box domain-containing protein n=2 Tax=Psilocybe cubensis TaxID=181762 RepID=A0A8H7Y4F9_PSICU|nr:hypothetical protein JR316_0003177 [Psilocybe cubensis]KAH9483704.1 hypothetical protein JR316_0003177 [Psilocybe cubensis]
MMLPQLSRQSSQVELGQAPSGSSIPADTASATAETVTDTGLEHATETTIAGDGQDDSRGSVIVAAAASTDEQSVAATSAQDKKKGKTKAAGPKRKRTVSDSAPGELTTKKLRGSDSEGRLVDLMKIFPEELFREVLSYLDPVDLLHMARTDKKMRDFLMSKNSRLEWKKARENISGLPDCPDDLSEPQYANLVFEKHCHFCLRHSSIIIIYWTSRVRICSQCNGGKFRSIKGGPPALPKSVRPYVPHFVRSVGHGPRSHNRTYYNFAVEKKWVEEYSMAPDKERWAQEKIEMGKKIIEHSEACKAWYSEYKKKKEEEENALVQTRVDKILDLLREMGWGIELDDMGNQPDDEDVVDKFIVPLYQGCQKELTDRSTRKLLPTLTTYLKVYKEWRLKRIRTQCLQARARRLHRIVNSYRPTIGPSIIPLDIGNIYSQRAVMNLLLSPTEWEPRLEDLLPQFPQFELETLQEIARQLVQMVQAVRGSAHGLDVNTLLTLATTTFSCEAAQYREPRTLDVIRYPRVIWHGCATELVEVPTDVSAPESELSVIADAVGRIPWNTNGRIMYDVDTHWIMDHVLTLCGFNPDTTTAALMNRVSPVIECISCNDMHKGRMVMRWDAVPAHAFQCHKGQWRDTMRLTTLGGDFANVLKGRLDEEYHRKRASDAYNYMLCTLCRFRGTIVRVCQHIKDIHGVAKPSEAAGDFVCSPDAPTLAITYRAWPPRDEDEPIHPVHYVPTS